MIAAYRRLGRGRGPTRLVVLIPEVEPSRAWEWVLPNQRGIIPERAIDGGTSNVVLCRLRFRLATLTATPAGESEPAAKRQAVPETQAASGTPRRRRRWQDRRHGFPRGGRAVTVPAHSERPVAVVTGASRGVGLEVGRQLAALGYTVVLGSRDPRRAELAAKELDPEGDQVTPAHVEVDNSVNIEQLAEWIRERFGRVDAIVNNASTAPDLWGISGTTDLSPVAEALDVNLFGAWRVVQALLPLLRSSPRPRIVNVSSESGAIALMSGGRPGFSVSKAALNALTRTLAGELYRDGILVNAVCPGPVSTDGARSSGRSAAQGAASVVWAVTLPNGGPTGTFTRDGRELPW